MKKQYEQPKFESVVLLTDVVMASGFGGENGDDYIFDSMDLRR